jgi:hypothetical protein
MSEQQSQKRGLRSEGQKEDRARSGYDPIPATGRVAGAFGNREDESITDEDLALKKAKNQGTEQRSKI